MSEMEQKLRNEAKTLLEQGKVDYIIGYEPGSLKFTTTPLITADKDDTERLVINPFIVNNLSVFLRETDGKVGIIAKECDSRSIVSLIQDQQIARENVVIIGVPCSGVIDLNKVERLVGKDRDEMEDISLEGDKVVVSSDKVSEPVAVRYAWADNPVCNLYNKEGLPASPFRTDSWPGVTADSK